MAYNRIAEQSSTEEGDVASKAIDGRLGNGESSDNLTLRVKKYVVKLKQYKVYQNIRIQC